MKKVCMFLTNTYENDARVKRECSALIEAGYKLKLVCVQNHHRRLDKIEEDGNFKLIRIEQFSPSMRVIYELWRWIRKEALEIIKNKKKIIAFLPILLLTAPVYLIFKLLCIRSIFRKFKEIGIKYRMIKEGMKEDYDIYHCNDIETLVQGMICGKVLRNRFIIYDSHEVQTHKLGYGKRSIIKFFEKFCVGKVDKMVMTTETRANYTQQIYGVKPEVIHNYPFYVHRKKSKNNIRELADIDSDEPILLYQGGIQSGRGLEKIIQAVPKIKRGIVVFIGDGSIKNELIEMAEKLGVKERVRFIPKVKSEELLYYTQHAYLGFQVLQNVCFNHYSTLSNKLFEYMMMEVPVVASNFPEIQKVVSMEKTGVCINPHEADNIAEAVNMLLDNRRLYNKLKGNCRFAKEKYNWNWEKHKFISIYNNLINTYESRHESLHRV